MHFLALHPKHQFSPMVVFSSDPSKVVNDILDTSESCKNASRSFVLEPHKVLRLDPGGLYSLREKQVPFTVGGYDFEIQLSKISDVLYYTGVTDERIPGYIRFKNFGQNVVMPTDLLKRVRAELVNLSKTDAALHAQITDYEQKAAMEAECPFVRFNIPRER